MMAVPEYQVCETLYQSNTTWVIRAVQTSDHLAVILKRFKKSDPSPEEQAQLQREYEITRQMDLPGVIKMIALIPGGLVVEDFGGEALSRLISAGRLPVGDFLKLAIDITHALGQIHAQHIIHKDINPSNLVFNPKTGQVKIIDFGIATSLSTEKQFFGSPEELEGTLPYISPEQTGRMNRAVDQRSDLYSLGVTFYELLAGTRPFQGKDAISLVHEHIAVLPPELKNILPDIPIPISNIVFKLMAKNAEERYQSCYGLQADLEKCLAQLQSTGNIQEFALAEADFSEQFHLPQKLYGRDTELATLLSAFERTISGVSRNELLLISGAAGVGKTSLVQEVYKPLTRWHGYFISGKFDQFQRNIPYFALIQAFHSLVNQLLSENAEQIACWRRDLLKALDGNAQVILDIIPALAMITGPQPPVVELPPAQAQNRYRLAFQNFIRVFTTSAHPLVLFLDDLQWSDAATLELLEFLTTSADQHYLFIIGAYRHNELGENHPLGLTVQRIQQTTGVIPTIFLNPLDLADISRFILDTFHVSLENARSLARLVENKTGGNPFFINEFLKALVSQKLISFSQPQGWHWDIELIRAQQITDNVADLVTSNIYQLPGSTQDLLELAACLGNQFDLRQLALIGDRSTQKTAHALWEATKAGLILPLNDAYKLALIGAGDAFQSQRAEYQFAHDRIRQTVYSLIPDEKRRKIHQQIGEYLLQNTPAEKQVEIIFDIAHHLNLAGVSGMQPSAKYALAEINLQAGRQGKKSAAFKPAFIYLQAGLDLLEGRGWQEQYPLTLALIQEALDVAYSSGYLEACEALAEEVFSHARELKDKLAAYQVKIKILVSKNQPVQALELALDVLKLLGIELTLRPSQADIASSLEKVQRCLAGRQIEDLIDLPEMSDPYKLAALQVLTSSTVAAFNSIPALYSLISFERVSLSIQYGNTQMSPAAYASYGLYLCGVGEIEQGYGFGRLALNLLEKIKALPFTARTWVTAYTFTIHWKEPLHNILEPLLQAYVRGVQTGDVEFATGALVASAHTDFLCGTELSQVQSHLTAHIAAIRQLKHRRNQMVVELHLQMVLNLLLQPDCPDRITGDIFDEDQALQQFQRSNDRFLIFHLYFYKALLGYLFYQFDRALENLELAEKHLDSVRAEFIYASFYFYQSLVALALFPARIPDEQQRLLAQVASNQEKLKTWARFAPANHLNKYTLVEAERARILGLGGEAREAYDQAIALAQQNHFIQEEALACELAAKFYLARGQSRSGNTYLLDAHKAYQRWGAGAKVSQLEEVYPQVLAHKFSAQPLSTNIDITTTSKSSAGSLDLVSLLKASQALSGEIVLKTLLEKLMRSIIENAGAQKGYLILENEGQWWIEAGGNSLEELEKSLESLPLVSDPPRLAASVVHFVIHTREALVLQDATFESNFSRDPYISSHRTKSLLCIPLVNQLNLVGVLYLENNLVTGAFTSQRVEFLRLLSVQAAISIENARFYGLLEQKVAQRTHELQEEVLRRRQAEERAQQLAITDPLTGLQNRRHFFAMLENEILRARRYQTGFAVILLDIDYFKQVNDHYGHLVGDQVLRGLAERVRANFRAVDTLARYGGEEFIFLLPESDLENAVRAAERLRLDLEKKPLETATGIVGITVSSGVTLFNPQTDSTPDSILERADKALYQSKDQGRNRVSSISADSDMLAGSVE